MSKAILALVGVAAGVGVIVAISKNAHAAEPAKLGGFENLFGPPGSLFGGPPLTPRGGRPPPAPPVIPNVDQGSGLEVGGHYAFGVSSRTLSSSTDMKAALEKSNFSSVVLRQFVSAAKPTGSPSVFLYDVMDAIWLGDNGPGAIEFAKNMLLTGTYALMSEPVKVATRTA